MIEDFFLHFDRVSLILSFSLILAHQFQIDDVVYRDNFLF